MQAFRFPPFASPSLESYVAKFVTQAFVLLYYQLQKFL